MASVARSPKSVGSGREGGGGGGSGHIPHFMTWSIYRDGQSWGGVVNFENFKVS